MKSQFLKHLLYLRIKWESFEKEELKKERKIVNDSWFDSLINYIPKSIKNIAGGFKDKILNLYNSKNSEVVFGSRKKLSKLKIQKNQKTI